MTGAEMSCYDWCIPFVIMTSNTEDLKQVRVELL
jgi:hypothetical protein